MATAHCPGGFSFSHSKYHHPHVEEDSEKDGTERVEDEGDLQDHFPGSGAGYFDVITVELLRDVSVYLRV